jgi:hypothetical protein
VALIIFPKRVMNAPIVNELAVLQKKGPITPLVGREFVRIRGILLGLQPDQIDALADEVIDFCELGRYIDMPVRTYSTGMLVRLAFAVVTSVTSEILRFDFNRSWRRALCEQGAIALASLYRAIEHPHCRHSQPLGACCLRADRRPAAVESGNSPSIMLNRGMMRPFVGSVVLPAPLWPISPTREPFLISNDMLSIARTTIAPRAPVAMAPPTWEALRTILVTGLTKSLWLSDRLRAS